jgi:hypothetical protein
VSTDLQNHRLRQLRDGVVSTLAGSGDMGFRDGVGAAARFDQPAECALDARDPGRLFVADAGNDRIRCVTLATGEVRVIM